MKQVELIITDDKLRHWAANEAGALEIRGRCGGAGIARRTAWRLDSIRAAAARLSGRIEKAASRRSGRGAGDMPQAVEWLLDNRYLIEREGLEALGQLRRSRGLPAAGAARVPALYILMEALVRAGGGEITPGRIGTFLDGVQSVRALSERELWLMIPMLKAALVAYALEGCRSIPAQVSANNAGHKAGDARAAAILSATVTSLRMLSVTDLTPLLRQSSVMEGLLQKDPAGVYSRMDEETRGRYRQELSRLAKRAGLTEVKAAERVLELCRKGKRRAAPPLDTGDASALRHVGYYIFTQPLGRTVKHRAWLYFAGLAALTALAAGLAAFWGGAGEMSLSIGIGLLLLIPLSEAAKPVCDAAALKLSRPRVTPRLEFKEGLPPSCATLCVTAVLLTDEKSASALVQRMESFYHLCHDARGEGSSLCFGLLADLPDARTAKKSGDKRLLERVLADVSELNRKYGGENGCDFYLFLRDRRFNVRDKLYMGWERKRGALLELMGLLRSVPERITHPPEPGRLYAAAGDTARLRDIQYVITLDADTQLTPGSVRELVGAMAHPMNAPHVDPERRVVTRGYGVMLPRMAVDLESAGKTLFSRVYAGQGGLDPYGAAAGEVYYDLFSEATFTGKGIFHVDTYLKVLDGRLPQNRVLSHDLLEGAYLRAGLAGDVELIDGCPHKTAAWFDRLHRWTRGDWQIASWLCLTVPFDGNKRERNPINRLSQWKIFDNLRRSLAPVLLLMAFSLSLIRLPGGIVPVSARLAIGAAALLCLLAPLLLSSFDLAFRAVTGRGSPAAPSASRRERYHSTIITGVRAVLLQVALQFVFLPYTAWVSASASLTALWRVLVSKRNLLRWVTSAQSERGRENSVRLFRKMYPAVVWGVLTGIFAANGFGIFCGIIWVSSPIIAYRISQLAPLPAQLAPLQDADRAFLCRQAALMWRYFDDLLTGSDHFLPPDNWQEQPAAGIAHRTSPTNIGLALLCCLTAVDLHLCGTERALYLIGRILSTVESMPKWHGHLLNWVDTRTLEPMHPRCVSTVDSGNFVGCLIALRQGLLEMDNPEAGSLAERAGRLSDATDFRPLFDPERLLFSICYDLEKEALADGYYDLLASEARQTSYIAIARGEVDRRSWKRLGRSLVSDEGFRGMASWTGTMFEYFMPHLLLPAPNNSLLYESLMFALRMQKRRGARAGSSSGIPWGISESCFYAFDPALNYQYKAHGVPGLAFKRGMGKEQVISPYSSFLALPADPGGASDNLRRLAALGLEGRYGLYEAADYTPSRQMGPEPGFEMVRCFMAHHIGMSLVAVDNALREGVWQRRFMRDERMGAFSALLQERVPAGVSAIRTIGREVPDKPSRVLSEGLRRETTAPDPSNPMCHILSNTAYTLLCTDTGLNASSCAGTALTLMESAGPSSKGSVYVVLRAGDRVDTLLPVPQEYREEYNVALEGGYALWERQNERFTGEAAVCVPGNENAELRVIRITNTGNEPMEGEIAIYFEPVLQREDDYRAHPAFSKLSIQTQAVEKNDRREGGVLFRRRARGNRQEQFLAFLCDREAYYETSREAALGRGGVDALEPLMEKRGSVSPGYGSLGTVLDPCLLARIPIRVARGESMEVRCALAYAGSEEDAVSAAERCTAAPLPQSDLPAAGRIDGAARMLSMSRSEALSALDKLSGLMFPRRSAALGGVTSDELDSGLALGQQGLWKYGVSGDLPILSFRAIDAADIERLQGVMRQHRFLSLCGFRCDLLILSRDGGDYRRPVRSAVMDALKAVGAEGSLGARGGVHIADLTGVSREEELLLVAAAWAEAGTETPRLPQSPDKSVRDRHFMINPKLKPHWDDDSGAVTFRTNEGLPPLAWGHVLANPSFGCLVTECGPGLSWRGNARENKLTRWYNDPLSASGSETLRLRTGGPSKREFSVFAAPDGLHCEVTYGFGWARWIKRTGSVTVSTTAFVPRNRMARVMILEIQGAADAELWYESELLLGGREQDRRMIRVTRDSGGQIEAVHPYASPGETYHLMASVPPRLAEGECPGCLRARLYPVRRGGVQRLVLVTGCSRNARGAELLRTLADDHEASLFLRETEEYWSDLVFKRRVQTGDAAMNRYLNGWALYQVIACRMFARASQYQCGGAYGFRDQLQDACAAVHADPNLLRLQILRACAHQYEEGDVQHWWHPGQNPAGFSDKGVRTRVTDDLLWLPYAVCEYLEKTGDRELLRAMAPFLISAPLGEDQHDRYEQPRRTAYRASVYEHCVRAVDAFKRRGLGVHGLPLMGTGDWNDGFDKVGAGGRGESVWLGWFSALVLRRMAPWCERMGDAARMEDYHFWASRLIQAGAAAWDGEWFRRGYYDDGSTLGSRQDDECRIDSIAQSFAAYFADELPDGYVKTALESACQMLVDEEHRLIRLFDPPFDNGLRQPGYIKGYVPGVRENGGQYTHAAVWLAHACLLLGEREKGEHLLKLLLPSGRDPNSYKAEPYVLAADVYGAPQHIGRGGWTWYTGAAGWYYRVAMECYSPAHERESPANV